MTKLGMHTQEINFAKDIFGNLLVDIMEWIATHFEPEDVFDAGVLETWATENGWTEPE